MDKYNYIILQALLILYILQANWVIFSKNMLWDEWGLNLRKCYRLKESTCSNNQRRN